MVQSTGNPTASFAPLHAREFGYNIFTTLNSAVENLSTSFNAIGTGVHATSWRVGVLPCLTQLHSIAFTASP